MNILMDRAHTPPPRSSAAAADHGGGTHPTERRAVQCSLRQHKPKQTKQPQRKGGSSSAGPRSVKQLCQPQTALILNTPIPAKFGAMAPSLRKAHNEGVTALAHELLASENEQNELGKRFQKNERLHWLAQGKTEPRRKVAKRQLAQFGREKNHPLEKGTNFLKRQGLP